MMTSRVWPKLLCTAWITIGPAGACARSPQQAVAPALGPPLLQPPPASIAVAGRQLWFSADAGMAGPNPVIVFRVQDTTVAGEVLVRYAGTEGGRRGRARYAHLCDSHEWQSGALDSHPTRFCRVPLGPKALNWPAALRQVDSLLDHRPAISTTPNDSAQGREAWRQRVVMSCTDQEGWWIAEAQGHSRTMHRLIETGHGCAATDSVASAYNEAGHHLFRSLLHQVESAATPASGHR